MKKIKKLFFAWCVALSMLSANAISADFKYTVLYGVKLSMPIENRKHDSIKPSGVPICEENGAIGELDCFGRLYVDNDMLTNMVRNKGSYTVNDIIFDNYRDDKINTYYVTSMQSLFSSISVLHPIVNWDVSNVTNMRLMFRYSFQFNQDISGWDVGNVINMQEMFAGRRVLNGNYVVTNHRFNQDLRSWNVCKLNNNTKDINIYGTWNLNNRPLFTNCISESFDELRYDKDGRLFVNKTILKKMADSAHDGIITSDGHPILMTYSHDDVNVSEITDMSGMFSGRTVRHNVYEWDVSNVVNMASMFSSSTGFNQPIGDWDVSKVTDMRSMFYLTGMNYPLNDWDVSNVTTMDSMFRHAFRFNQPLDKWDVGNVVNMKYMFAGRRVLNGNYVVTRTTFNQDLSGWNTCKVSVNNRDNINEYGAWSHSNQPLFDNCIKERSSELRYDSNGRLYVDKTILKKMVSSSYDGIITSDAVVIKLTYGHNDINVSEIADMSSLFSGIRVRHDITGWDVSNVVNMASMFSNSTGFNQSIGNWDVSKVTDMRSMFYLTGINQSLNDWNVSNVTRMDSMFRYAFNFDQPLNKWDVSNVINMQQMFAGRQVLNGNYVVTRTKFNQDLTGWNVCNVRNTTNINQYGSWAAINRPRFNNPECNS